MKKHCLILILLILGNIVPAIAAQETPLTLNLPEVIKIAQERNVQVIVANERVQQAIARIAQNRSILLPQVTTTASQTRQTRDIRASGIPIPTSEEVIGPFNAFDARVHLTQTLFDASAVQRLKAARVDEKLSTAALRKTQQDVLSLVATLFVEARRTEQNKKFVQSLVDRDRKHLEIIQARQQSGLSSILELKQAQAVYDQSLYQYQMAVKDSQEKRLDLLAALGWEAEQAVILADDDQLPIIDIASLDKTAEFLKNQPDVIAAQKQMEERKSEQNAQRAEYLPKVSAFGDYGSSGIRPNDANDTYTLGVQASLPIFEGGFRQAKVKEAESKWRESEAILNNTKLSVKADLLTAVETLRATELFMKANESALAVTQQQLGQAEQRLKNGAGSSLDLIDAQTEIISKQYQQYDAKSTYLLARINLARALGHVEDLGKLNNSNP